MFEEMILFFGNQHQLFGCSSKVLRKLFENCSERLRKFFGICCRPLRNLFRTEPGQSRDRLGTSSAAVRPVFERYSDGVPRDSGESEQIPNLGRLWSGSGIGLSGTNPGKQDINRTTTGHLPDIHRTPSRQNSLSARFASYV